MSDLYNTISNRWPTSAQLDVLSAYKYKEFLQSSTLLSHTGKSDRLTVVIHDYRTLRKEEKPVLREVGVWPQETIPTLQD